MNNMFKVIFTGKLKDTADINKVAEVFAKKFKMSPEKALKILQANKPLTLVKKAEHVKAYKLKSMFEEMGMIAELKPVTHAISKAKIETKPEPEHVSPAKTPQPETLSLEQPQPNNKESEASDFEVSNKATYAKPKINSRHKANKNDEEKEGIFKKFGKVMLAIGAGIIIFLKKFGLFKFLKIGALIAAGSAIGFDSEEACMGNSRCEDAVSDQIDDCWDNSGLEDFDFDKMSDDEYNAIQPKIENDFIGCLKYPDTGKEIFHHPIDLRFLLIERCNEIDLDNCNTIVEAQIDSCYDRYKLGKYFNKDTTDYYRTLTNNQDKIEKFFDCFVDDEGDSLNEYQ